MGEEATYILSFTNVSYRTLSEENWEGRIWSPRSILERYDPDHFHPLNDRFNDLGDDIAWYVHDYALGPLGHGESTHVQLKLKAAHREDYDFEAIPHMDTISISCYGPNPRFVRFPNPQLVRMQYPILFSPELQSSDIVQTIRGPNKVDQGQQVTYLFSIENCTEYDFSHSSSNQAQWQIFIPEIFVDQELIDSTVGLYLEQTIQTSWPLTNYIRYTFYPHYFIPGVTEFVTFRFTIPESNFYYYTEEFALFTQFVNENTSSSDGVPFLHLFSGFSPLVISSGIP